MLEQTHVYCKRFCKNCLSKNFGVSSLYLFSNYHDLFCVYFCRGEIFTYRYDVFWYLKATSFLLSFPLGSLVLCLVPLFWWNDSLTFPFKDLKTKYGNAVLVLTIEYLVRWSVTISPEMPGKCMRTVSRLKYSILFTSQAELCVQKALKIIV